MGNPAEPAINYDTDQNDANADLDKLFEAAGKGGATTSSFGLSLAQKGMPKNDVLMAITHKSNMKGSSSIE